MLTLMDCTEKLILCQNKCKCLIEKLKVLLQGMKVDKVGAPVQVKKVSNKPSRKFSSFMAMMRLQRWIKRFKKSGG